MIYEMRVYDMKPGKLAANDKRFGEANIVGLFEKHDIKVVGFWHTAIGENYTNRLTYLLGFENMTHREECWESWRNDPTWYRKRAETDPENEWIEQIDTTILVPTEYSPMQ